MNRSRDQKVREDVPSYTAFSEIQGCGPGGGERVGQRGGGRHGDGLAVCVLIRVVYAGLYTQGVSAETSHTQVPGKAGGTQRAL